MVKAVIVVRATQPHEIDRVANIHQAARGTYYRQAGHEPDPKTEPRASEWRGYLEQPGMHLACAYAGSSADALGFACAYDGQEAGRGGLWSVELVGLYVDPNRWSRGAGSALHAWFCDLLAQSSTAEAGTLYVWSHNTNARDFYAKRGWQEAGPSYAGPLDAPFISLRLDRPRSR